MGIIGALHILTALGGLFGGATSFAVLFGPVGLAVAGIAAFFERRVVKVVLVLIGLALIAITAAVIAVYIADLEHDRAAYVEQSAMVAALAAEHHCLAHQRLDACLAAERAAVEHARAEYLDRLQKSLALSQAALAAAEADNRKMSDDLASFIDQAARAGDGDMPQIFIDAYSYQRKRRGAQ